MGQEVPLVLLAGASNEKLVTVIGTAQAGLEKRQIPPSMTDIALLNSFIFRFSFFSTTTPSREMRDPSTTPDQVNAELPQDLRVDAPQKTGTYPYDRHYACHSGSLQI